MTAARQSMLWMCVFAALWATVEALAAHLSKPYSPFEVVWVRYGVHLLFMFGIWGWREPALLWRTRRPSFQLSRSLLMLVMPSSYVFALRAGLAHSTMIGMFWLAPLIILILARMLLTERAGGGMWLASVCGYIGVVLAEGSLVIPRTVAVLFPLLTAMSFSLYIVMTRSLRNERTHTNLFYTALGVFLGLTPLMPQVFILPSPHDAVVLCGIGVIGFFTLLALDRMTASAPISYAAPIAYLQLPFLWAIAFRQDDPWMGRKVAGFALIALAALGVWMFGSKLTVRELA